MKALKFIFLFISLIAMFLVYWLLGFVFFKGFLTISPELMFGDTSAFDALSLKKNVYDGILPAIIGTLMLVGLTMAIGTFFGIFSGIYISVYASKRVKKLLNLCFELLASVPSLLVGLFFLVLSIELNHKFSKTIMPSMLLSAIALSTLVMPYLVKSTSECIESIPKNVRNLGLNLGLNKTQNLFKILLPYSSKGLISGILLALGRACEDTSAIMLTGAVASAGMVFSVFERYEALPFYIYYISSNYADDNELNRAFGAALVLLVLASGLFVLAKFIQKKV